MSDYNDSPRGVTGPISRSVTAQHATELRTERDLTDDDIRSDFVQRLNDRDVAVERAKDTSTRRGWERDAARDAVSGVIRDYFDAMGEFGYNEHGGIGSVRGEIADLEGVTITVTIRDLVATATLTPPTA